jgi:hypothetical protein
MEMRCIILGGRAAAVGKDSMEIREGGKRGILFLYEITRTYSTTIRLTLV